MINFLLSNLAFISICLYLTTAIYDYKYKVEVLGFLELPMWTFDILIFPFGVLRFIYLGLR